MEEDYLNLQYYVDLLKRKKDSLEFQNDLAHKIKTCLKCGKNQFKKKRGRYYPNPGMIKYSKNCCSFRNNYSNKRANKKQKSVKKRIVKIFYQSSKINYKEFFVK